MIGFKASSLFLKYLEVYQICCDSFFFRFLISQVPYNKQQVLNNPMAIKSSLQFEKNITNYYHLYDTQVVSFPVVKLVMNHSSSQLNEGFVDLTEPSFFRVGQSLYIEMIDYVKKTICKNSSICFQRHHIYKGFDRNKIILIKFYNEKNQREKELPIKIQDIFFVDENDFIQFNFEAFDSDSSTINFGVMFLQEVDFYVKYNGNT